MSPILSLLVCRPCQARFEKAGSDASDAVFFPDEHVTAEEIPHVRCPRCGSSDVDVRTKPDAPAL